MTPNELADELERLAEGVRVREQYSGHAARRFAEEAELYRIRLGNAMYDHVATIIAALRQTETKR